MPSIEVSPEQHAYVVALQEELAEQVTYGHVRPQDAVQYLIDHHRTDGDLDVEVNADVDPDPETDEGTADLPTAGGGAATDGTADGPSAAAGTGDGVVVPDGMADGDAASGGTDDGEGDGDSDPEDSSPTVLESAAALQGGVAGSGGEGGGSDADGSDGSEDADEPGDTAGVESADGGSDDDTLNEMMRLLETHEDRWSESDGSDGKYEVELPDGGVETVMTRDDVRALLFRHYR